LRRRKKDFRFNPLRGRLRKLDSILAAGLVFLALFFSGCERIKEFQEKRKKNPGAPEAAVEAPVFAVNTTTAVKGLIRDYLALSGDIVAGSTVDTYSEVAGKISRIFVTLGGRVRKGDPVVEVDPSRPGMNFMPGIAEAPISGTITSLPAQVGMTVSQAVPLARIAGGNALEIKVYVAERFISQISMGLPCEISLDAWPGETFRGSVFEISPVVDPASRTMEVKINVENPGARIKVGMFAKVRIITRRKENIVKIPAGALVSRFGEQYVFAVDKTDPEAPTARKKIVVPGILIDGVLEIEQGLAPNEEIVIRGQSLLEDGSRINVIEQTAPLGAN
jgi:multidrug efflux pump subunit AcrA (membrane-fusion protein)